MLLGKFIVSKENRTFLQSRPLDHQFSNFRDFFFFFYFNSVKWLAVHIVDEFQIDNGPARSSSD